MQCKDMFLYMQIETDDYLLFRFIDVAYDGVTSVKADHFPIFMAFFLYRLNLMLQVWSKATKYMNIRVAINSHCILSLNIYKGKTDYMPYFPLVTLCSI